MVSLGEAMGSPLLLLSLIYYCVAILSCVAGNQVCQPQIDTCGGVSPTSLLPEWLLALVDTLAHCAGGRRQP